MEEALSAGGLILKLYIGEEPERGFELFEATYGDWISDQAIRFANRYSSCWYLRALQEDIAQDLCLRAHERLLKEATIAEHKRIRNLGAWLCVFTKRRLLDHIRKQGVRHRRAPVGHREDAASWDLNEDEQSRSSEEELIEILDRGQDPSTIALKQCREELPERSQVGIEVFIEPHATYQDVADAIGLKTRAGALKFVKKVLAMLRECVEQRLTIGTVGSGD